MYLNLEKAYLASGVRNSDPNSEATILGLPITISSSTILPMPTLLILSLPIDDDLWVAGPLLVRSIQIRGASM